MKVLFFLLSSLLFLDVSVGGSVSCITDFPAKVDEVVDTVRLTANFSSLFFPCPLPVLPARLL